MHKSLSFFVAENSFLFHVEQFYWTGATQIITVESLLKDIYMVSVSEHAEARGGCHVSFSIAPICVFLFPGRHEVSSSRSTLSPLEWSALP